MAGNSCERHRAVGWTELTNRMDGHWREQRYMTSSPGGGDIPEQKQEIPKGDLEEGKMITIVLDSDLMKPDLQIT